jgi:hypothetical protein
VVLHFREQDDVAGLEIFRAPGTGDEIDAFGGAAGENDFVGAAGVDEFAARVRAASKAAWRDCSIHGCRDGRWRCRARNNARARQSPRAAFATWRRCRNKSAACRGPAGRGWEILSQLCPVNCFARSSENF